MGTTPTYSWPYPEATDPVAQGAQDIEDLALAVESTVSGLGGGKILQVVSTTKTDTFSASIVAGGFTSVTGLSATITPTSASSQILALVDVNGAQVTDERAHIVIRLLRDSTNIGSGDASGSKTTAFSATRMNYAETGNVVSTAGSYLDSPATTSAITYSIQIGNATTATKTFVVNRSSKDSTDSVAFVRTSSTITLMEVSA